MAKGLVCLLVLASMLVGCVGEAGLAPGPTPQTVRIITDDQAREGRLHWQEPVSLSDAGALSPQVAVTSEGIVHLVWIQEVSGEMSRLVYRRFADGMWSEPETVAEGSVENPRIAVDGLGRLHLVWEEGARYKMYGQIMYRVRTGEGTWSEVEDLTESVGVKATPGVTAASDGSFHLAWSREPWGQDSLWYVWRKPDGAWQEPEEVREWEWGETPAGVGGMSAGPCAALAVDGDGTVHLAWGENAHVLWGEDVQPRGLLRYAERVGGRWSKPADLFYFQKGVSVPTLAMDGEGRLALLLETEWSESKMYPGVQEGVDRSAFFLMWRDRGGTWSVPETVPNVGLEARDMGFAMDGTGRVYLVWYERVMEGGQYGRQVFSTYRRAQEPSWGHAYAVSLDESTPLEQELVAVADGRLLLVAAVAPGGDFDERRVVALEGVFEPFE